MNSTTLSSSATSANASRSAEARPAGDSPASRDGNSSTNGQPSRDAAALAKLVLPVPGGPNNTTARGGTRPSRSASCGCASGKMTRRSISSFSPAMPPRSSQAPARTIRPPSRPSAPALPASTGSSRSYKTIP
jgi:hypothetical protein